MESSSKKIVVLGAQVPFIRGGAELLCESLVDKINSSIKGVEAEIVQMPFKWYPESQLIKDLTAWRLADISESNGQPIDLCISTKFPTYAAKHTNKVTWLVHQHRVFYDLEGSAYDVPHSREEDNIVRQKVKELDGKYLNESKTICTISQTVTDRLRHYNGLESQPVYPPPKLADQIKPGDYGNYILYIGRVEKIKRIDPLVEALVTATTARVRIVGAGRHAAALQNRANELGLADRCIFEGYVSDERYLQLLAGARGVFYGPLDEDYGYATIEAFLARKPVITFGDSGEVTKIVQATCGGFVCGVEVSELADCLTRFTAMPSADVKKIGESGFEFARSITWKKVLDNLVMPFI